VVFKRSRDVRQAAPAQPPQPAGIAVRVFTPDYVVGGYVAPTGQAFLGWLNNVNQRAIVLTRAQAMGLAPDSAVQSFSPSEVTLPKGRIVALDLMDPAARRTIQLAPRRVPAALYAGGFIFRANLHPTGEMQVTHLFNVMGGTFFSVSEARIGSAVPIRDFGPAQAEILLINQQWVDFFHALPA
jgi:hypothetical protein